MSTVEDTIMRVLDDAMQFRDEFQQMKDDLMLSELNNLRYEIATARQMLAEAKRKSGDSRAASLKEVYEYYFNMVSQKANRLSAGFGKSYDCFDDNELWDDLIFNKLLR